jgi:putative ABC transport system permease protein
MFLVPELSPHDPFSVVTVSATLFLVGMVATLLPAIRALRVDPIIALRYE